MASKIHADWTEELSLKVENCPEHSGFTLDFVCKQCRRNVCVRCVALDHPGHDIETLKAQTEQISEQRGNLEQIERDLKAQAELQKNHEKRERDLKAQTEPKSELKKNLEKRKRAVKIMKTNCLEMSRQVHETSEEKLCSIDQDRDRRRSSIILKRNDFERRAKSMTECLEKEENKIYALEANTLDDIQEELEKCTSAQLPRVKTYNDLKVKFERMQSPNRFSSSSTTTLEELASSPVLEPFTSICRRQSEGRDREQDQGAVEMEQSEDESDIENLPGDMDTGSGSDCEEMGAEGGLAFKSDRKGVIVGQMKEDEKSNDAHSGKDDLILSDLVEHLLPEHFRPLGLNLCLNNATIKHIRCDNHLDIGNAIYEVLQKWKGTLRAEVLTEEHFKTLEKCLRKIENEDAADWLIERLQKSTGQLVQPSSCPFQLGRPSSSPGQLRWPSSSPGQLGQASSSPGQLVQPSSSPSQLGQPCWPSSSPGQLGRPSSSPGQLGQASSSPGQLVQPSSSPGQLRRPSSSPGQLVQPSSSPGQLVQPSSSSCQLRQHSSSPGQLVHASSSSGQPVQPFSSPGQLVQHSSSPGQLVQPSSSSCQLRQPSSSPGQLVHASSSSGQPVQPSPSPGQLVQPSSSPGQLVQPSSSSCQLRQPSSSPGQLVHTSSSSGQPVQPSPSPGQIVQPSPSPGQLVQPSSSPGQLVQPSSSPGQLRQPSSSPGQLKQPSSSDSQ